MNRTSRTCELSLRLVRYQANAAGAGIGVVWLAQSNNTWVSRKRNCWDDSLRQFDVIICELGLSTYSLYYIYIYIYMYIYIYICIYLYLYIYIYVCVFILHIYVYIKHRQEVASLTRKRPARTSRYVIPSLSHGCPVGALVSMTRGRPMDVPIEHPSKYTLDIGGCRHFYVESTSTWVVRGTVAYRPSDVLRTSNSWQGYL